MASLGHPCTFQRVSRLGSITAQHSSSGRQPNFAAFNRRRHLYSAGRPSRWALAHILVSSYFIFKCKDNRIYSLLALSLFLYFTRCLLLLTVCSSRYWGKLSWYDGSGYIAEISNDIQTQLESSSWIDRRFVLNVTFVAFIQSVVLELVIMVALCNRADRPLYFCPVVSSFFLLSFFLS